jgi:polyhydroxyalkanoate synthesis regulator phasin
MRERSQRSLLWGVLVALALILAVNISATTRAGNELNQQQDVLRLDNRVTQLEQRLFSIETTLRNVEQQVRLASVPSRSGSQDELARVRSDVDALQRQLSDYECALAKLDERTLTPQKRALRKRTGNSDQCRANFDAPLQLP